MVSTEVIDVLSELLHDESQLLDVRVAAAEGLGFSGFSRGRDALLKTAHDERTDLLVRVAAIRALGHTLHTAK